MNEIVHLEVDATSLSGLPGLLNFAFESFLDFLEQQKDNQNLEWLWRWLND